MNPILEEDFKRILERVTPRLKEMAGSTIFITGAAGFIGSYLVDFFSYANKHYFTLPCSIEETDTLVANSRTPEWGQCLKFPRSYLMSADYIFHTASIASPQLYMRLPLETIVANVDLTESLLRMEKFHAMLHFSSSEVYGDPSPEFIPTPETYVGNVSFTGPRAVYDESKRFSETLCQIYFRKFGTPVRVVRPFNVYGPGHNLDDGRIVPQLMKALVRNEPFPVYGSGTATRSFCYISDAVVQMLAALLAGQPGEAYNVGDGGSEISISQFALTAQKIFPRLEIRQVENHETLADAPTRRRPDTRKILEIAASPMVSLEEGLERTYRYHAD